ncbi:MAG: DUF4231 domain-containing protein [Phycisphaeraceae bacterium]|nr:DUF4231 domain-containing protein [Phycisphaeraceae bacterium]
MAQPVYPSIFIAADNAAIKRQRAFVRGVAAQLVLLVVVSLTSSIQVRHAGVTTALVVVTALLTCAVLVISLWLRIARLDERWFQCRALAENTKGLAWRYAMGCTLRPGSTSPDTDLVDRIAELRQRLSETRHCLAEEDAGRDWITPWMREMRADTGANKLAALRALRIHDQQEWYARKARVNAGLSKRWFGVVLASELLALIAAVAWAVLHLSDPGAQWAIDVNLAGVLAAVAAAAVAWTQLRRHSDLVQTYQVAAEDLVRLDVLARGLEAKAGESPVDPALAPQIDELSTRVETAISREHSVWMGESLL